MHFRDSHPQPGQLSAAEIETMAKALVRLGRLAGDAPADLTAAIGVARRFLSGGEPQGAPESAPPPHCHIPADLFADLEEPTLEGGLQWV